MHGFFDWASQWWWSVHGKWPHSISEKNTFRMPLWLTQLSPGQPTYISMSIHTRIEAMDEQNALGINDLRAAGMSWSNSWWAVGGGCRIHFGVGHGSNSNLWFYRRWTCVQFFQMWLPSFSNWWFLDILNPNIPILLWSQIDLITKTHNICCGVIL